MYTYVEYACIHTFVSVFKNAIIMTFRLFYSAGGGRKAKIHQNTQCNEKVYTTYLLSLLSAVAKDAFTLASVWFSLIPRPLQGGETTSVPLC